MAFLLADLIDGQDVGMIQTGCSECLTLEAAEPEFVLGRLEDCGRRMGRKKKRCFGGLISVVD